MRGETLRQKQFTKRTIVRSVLATFCGLRASSAALALAEYSLAALLLATLLATPISGARAAPSAVVLDIEGAIGPATSEYVAREFRDLAQSDTRLIILRMNTPGGLDTSMR